MASAFRLPGWLERILCRHNASPVRHDWAESAALYRVDPIERRLMAGSILIPTPSGLLSNLDVAACFADAGIAQPATIGGTQATAEAATPSSTEGWSVDVVWSKPEGYTGSFLLLRQTVAPSEGAAAVYDALAVFGADDQLSYHLPGLTPDTGITFLLVAFDAGSFSDTAVQIDVSSLHAGDATGDGIVDFSDMLRVSQNYNQPKPLVDEAHPELGVRDFTWGEGNFTTGDGLVNFNDMLKISQNYNLDFNLPVPAISSATVVSSTQVHLSWSVGTGTAINPDGYLIWGSEDGETYRWMGATDTTNFDVCGLVPATTYHFRVDAIVGDRRSDYSIPVEIATPGIKGAVLADTGRYDLVVKLIDGDPWTVDWGDGQDSQVTASGVVQHDYATAGTYTITAGSGTFSSTLAVGIGVNPIPGLTIVNASGFVPTGWRDVLVTDDLTIPVDGEGYPKGVLDLADSDLRIQPAGPGSEALTELQGLIRAGFHGGDWWGIGVTTSWARTDPRRALGFMLNSDGGGNPIFSSFDGQAVDEYALLVRNTRYGDSNLNGTIDAGDVVPEPNSDPGTWATGDYNYNGVLDQGDVGLWESSLSAAPTPANVLSLGGAHVIGTTGDVGTITMESAYAGDDVTGSWTIDWGDDLTEPITLTGSGPWTASHPYDWPANGNITVFRGTSFTSNARRVRIGGVAGPSPVHVTGGGFADEGTPYDITFDAEPSVTVDHWVVAWGDGVMEQFAGTLGGAQHIYRQGTMDVVARVAAVAPGGGEIWSDPHAVHVANVAPSVTITGPTNSSEGSEVTFTADATDPSGFGDPLSYSWQIFRGASPLTLPPETVTDGATFSFVPPHHDNNYQVMVTVSDGEDETVDRYDFSVADVAPVLTVTGAPYAVAGESYTLTVASQDAGAEDAVTSWAVNWGDGSPASNVTGATGSAIHQYQVANEYGYQITAIATEDATRTYPAAPLRVIVGTAPAIISELVVEDPDAARGDAAQVWIRRDDGTAEGTVPIRLTATDPMDFDPMDYLEVSVGGELLYFTDHEALITFAANQTELRIDVLAVGLESDHVPAHFATIEVLNDENEPTHNAMIGYSGEKPAGIGGFPGPMDAGTTYEPAIAYEDAYEDITGAVFSPHTGEVNSGYIVYLNDNDDSDSGPSPSGDPNGKPDLLETYRWDPDLLPVRISLGGPGSLNFFIQQVAAGYIQVPGEVILRQTAGFGKIRVWGSDGSLRYKVGDSPILGDGIYERRWDLSPLQADPPDWSATVGLFEFLTIEGVERSNNVADVRLELEWTGQRYSSVSLPGFLDEMLITVEGPEHVDIDADTDNNGTIDRSWTEEGKEVVAGEPGLQVVVSDGDSDGDGLPDFVDGYNRDGVVGNEDDESADAAFKPITLSLPDYWVNPATHQLVIEYSASDPSGATVTGWGATLVATPASSGSLRLWTCETGRSIANFVPSGALSAALVSQLFPSGVKTATLYLEAVAPSAYAADQRITFRVAGAIVPDRAQDTDTIAITARRAVAPTVGAGSTPRTLVENADGNNTMGQSYLDIVGLRDGSVNLVASDLFTGGFSSFWGHTRVFSNQTGFQVDALNGRNVHVAELPSIAPGPGVEFNGLTARYGSRFDALEGFSLAETFTYADGRFAGKTDAAGVEWAPAYDSAGRLQTMSRTDGVLTEQLIYNYYEKNESSTSGAHDGLLKSVTLQRLGGRAAGVVGSAQYAYYLAAGARTWTGPCCRASQLPTALATSWRGGTTPTHHREPPRSGCRQRCSAPMVWLVTWPLRTSH